MLIITVLMITIKVLFGELHLNLWQLINRLWIWLLIFHFILVIVLSIRLFSLCYIILLRVFIDVKDTRVSLNYCSRILFAKLAARLVTLIALRCIYCLLLDVTNYDTLYFWTGLAIFVR